MEGAVYILCAVAALGCAALLGRGYRRSRVRLLLWSGLCFLALALENVILFVDVVLIPEEDFSALRLTVALVGVALLLYGLVWEDR